MKTVRFIRHAKAANSYASYDEFPFEDFCKLAKGELDPDIEIESEKKIIETFGQDDISFDTIFHSHATRARRTSQIIKKVSQRDIHLLESSNLKEIYFDPQYLATPQEFKEVGLNSIRKKLFDFMIEGKEGVESLDNAFERIENLKNEIRNSSHDSILCVTHSFFMRILVTHLLEGQSRVSISSEKLFNTHDYTYLDGFTTSI